jgi:LuxR family maltose regulon positive regulatory protein
MNMANASSPVLTNNLRVLLPDDHWLPRPELLRKLDAGQSCKLILVSAPLGYGKTTLITHFLSRSALPVAWITLEKGDDHLHDFIRKLANEVERALPASMSMTLSLAENSPAMSEAILVNRCLQDVSAIERPMFLVLDNCEVLSDAGIHQLMRSLLAALPPSVHLMALTRVDPPWHLAKLRLKNQVCDIRGADLQFNRQQVSQFINQNMPAAVDEEIVNWLMEYTEGWPAALQMARLAMSNHAPDMLLTSFRGTNLQITEYFAEEVFKSLSDQARILLMNAAVPDQFSPELVDFMLEGNLPHGAVDTIITELENAGLFIKPVDAERIWFRLHPIFRDFLIYHLRMKHGVAAYRRCNLLASEWFEQRQLYEPAVRHALAAGNVDRAAGIVLEMIMPVQANATAPIINRNLRLLALFTESDQNSRVDLLCVRLMTAMSQGNTVESERLIIQIEAQLQNDPCETDPALQTIARGMIKGYWGEKHYWRGKGADALAELDAALTLLPDRFSSHRNSILLFRAGALCQSHCKAEGVAAAQQFIADAMGRSDNSLFTAFTAQLMVHHIFIENKAVERSAQELLSYIEARNAAPNWHVFAWYFLGMVCLEGNDLTGAFQHFEKLSDLRYVGNTRIIHDGLLALALITQLNGDAERAMLLAREARQYAVITQNALSLEFSTSLEARLAVLQGRPQDALDMLPAVKPANRGFALWVERPRLTKAEALIALGGTANLKAALELTDAALENARQTNNGRLLIYSLVTQSAVLHSLNKVPDAMAALNEALRMGRQSGYVRPFVALRKPVGELLQRCTPAASLADFVLQLRKEMARSLPAQVEQGMKTGHILEHGVTPLTTREMEVLILVSERRSIDEMAQALFISPNTVKKHLANIYGKLGVKSGRQAVAKMREIGVLPPV